MDVIAVELSDKHMLRPYGIDSGKIRSEAQKSNTMVTFVRKNVHFKVNQTKLRATCSELFSREKKEFFQ